MNAKDYTNVTQELQQASEQLQWGHRTSDQLYGTKDLYRTLHWLSYTAM